MDVGRDARSQHEVAHSNQNPNKTVAIVDGEPVTMADLWPGIAEFSGAVALEEAILDRGIARRIEALGIVVSSADVEAERMAVREAIAGEVGPDESLADQALARVRDARGLGPTRFRALVERNAKLRALVRPTVEVTGEEVAAEMELQIGSKVSAIVALFGTEKEASIVRAGLIDAPGPSLERLAALAVARSIDVSAREGGRVGPIHPNDPRVSGSLRTVLAQLAIGEVSPVLASEGGYAIVMIEKRTEALSPSAEAEVAARSTVRGRKERVAMDRLARSILSEASINVVDDSIRWGWQRARRGN